MHLAMDTVLHLSKRLSQRPTPGTISGIELRHFVGPDDIPVWLDLRHRAFARAKPGVQSWDRAEFATEFLNKPWWSPERIWFAVAGDPSTNDSSAIGTIALADRGTGAQAVPAVHWLAVLPGWRRGGVGRLLLEALEQRCWDLGQREIFLETHEGWTAARRLYESLGYQATRGAIPMS
jgi:GNAT superfamily N-acetyltransferase